MAAKVDCDEQSSAIGPIRKPITLTKKTRRSSIVYERIQDSTYEPTLILNP